MASSVVSVTTEMIPLGLVIALSPLTIIPAVLVLHSPKPRPAGLAYLAGWVVALAVLTAIAVEISGLAVGFGHPPRWADWVRIVIGTALIVFGIWRWFTRGRGGHSPKWMRALTESTPTRAGMTGALLAVVNPKVFFLCIAAGVAAGTGGLGTAGTWTAAVFFVLVSAATVALPVLAYVFSGERLREPLSRLKEWMETHNAALMAAILVVIGLLVLYKGLSHLLA